MKYRLLLCLLLVGFHARAQDHRLVDSLRLVYQKTKADTTKAMLLMTIAYEYRAQKFDTSIALVQRAIEMCEKQHFLKGEAQAYQKMGTIYRQKGHYVEAMRTLQKGLSLFEKIGDEKGISASLTGLGSLYVHQAKFKEGHEYLEKSIALSKKINDEDELAVTYNALGRLLSDEGRHKEAEKMLLEAMRLGAKQNKILVLSYAHNNLADVYRKQKQYAQAEALYKKSLELKAKINDRWGSTYSYNGLAKIFLEKKEYPQALQYAHKGLAIAEELHTLLEVKQISQTLYDVYLQMGDYKEALNYHVRHKRANDSLFNVERTRAITDLENKAIFEKKEAELALHKFMQYIYLAIAGVILLALTMVGWALRQKQKANRLLEAQNRQIEAQGKEIAEKNADLFQINEELKQQQEELVVLNDSLTTQNAKVEAMYERLNATTTELNKSIQYASRVQTTVMPDEEDLKGFFADYFVLFRPRDVVSGDFYWLSNIEHNRGVWAVGDCTGHGVPGAFMTMLGCTVLHEIVNIEGVREDAARILKFMHRAISNVLKQDRSENHDGMDITLVIFEKDFSNRQVSLNFAGAKASMSYIRAGELCTLSGDRQFLGGETLRREFTNHYLTLPADTCFYFYTDGYKDQNDARRKKIGNVFKDVLLQYYQQPMPRQLEAMSELLDGHQLGVRQRDDITLIGLRLFS